MEEESKKIDLSTLPREFRACCWDDGWEFEMPLVVYFPKKYRRLASVGSTGCADQVVEDICIDISLGLKPNDGGLVDDCEWRGWSLDGFAKRKNAWHTVIKGNWIQDEDGELEFVQCFNETVYGPLKNKENNET